MKKAPMLERIENANRDEEIMTTSIEAGSLVGLIILVLLLLTGCGGGVEESTHYDPNAPLVIDVTQTSVEWAAARDVQARAWVVIDEALIYWRGTRDDLRGWTLRFTDDPAVGGATAPGPRVILIGTHFGPCVEAQPITHEVGHVVLADYTDPHVDPRWIDVRHAGEGWCAP